MSCSSIPCRGTGLGTVMVQQLAQGAAPLVALDPSDQCGVGGQLAPIGMTLNGLSGSARGKGWGAENGILAVNLTGKRYTR